MAKDKTLNATAAPDSTIDEGEVTQVEGASLDGQESKVEDQKVESLEEKASSDGEADPSTLDPEANPTPPQTPPTPLQTGDELPAPPVQSYHYKPTNGRALQLAPGVHVPAEGVTHRGRHPKLDLFEGRFLTVTAVD